MGYELYRWIVPAVAIYFIFRLGRQVLKKQRTLRGSVIWFTWWLAIIFMALVPDKLSQHIAELLGFESNVNAVVFVSLGILFFFTFFYSTSIDRLERQISQMVRDQASHDATREAERYKLEQLLESLESKKSDEDTLRA